MGVFANEDCARSPLGVSIDPQFSQETMPALAASSIQQLTT